jgi:alkanesulfonate monooxygenase SsuD/methylene tetrahydromethanopterin reductase-like flavin-dependent oxidoreductase (luciferase family)
MKIGYFCNPTNLGHRRPYADVLEQVRDLAAFCDTHDFDTLWLAEHHFSLWGREVLPNPILMAADLAARTRRLRIGLGAAIITFWHPLRLAEDVALLDQLCGGRLELGLGRGNYGLEGLNLNPHADPNKPEENYTVFDETLQILKLAFSESQFAFKGSKYVFPTPGFRQDRAHTVDLPGYVDPETGEMIRISVYPQPLQRPHPPMWQVVDSAGSVEYAARNGLGVIMWRPPLETLKQHFRMHGEVWRDAGHAGEPRTAILRDTFVAESRAQARELAGEYVMKALNWYNWRGPAVYLQPGEQLDASVETQLRKELSFEFVDERSLLFGTPDDVAERLIELHREAGVDEVLINSHWSDIPHERSMKSLALFSSEVLPRLAAAGLRSGSTQTPRSVSAGT